VDDALAITQGTGEPVNPGDQQRVGLAQELERLAAPGIFKC
jgi:hypothetical protein